jgi:hypothetical protein
VEPEEVEADSDAEYDDNADALGSSYDGRLMDDTSPTSNSSDISMRLAEMTNRWTMTMQSVTRSRHLR